MNVKFKRIVIPKIRYGFTGVIVILLLIVSLKLYRVVSSVAANTGLTPVSIVKILLNGGVTLKTSNHRINVLLLGMGGGSHEGPDLTDTLMVLSIDEYSHSMVMISLPRDIWSDTLKDKINSAYHYGEEKKSGGGLLLAQAIVEDIVGLPVHYTFTVDFSGFKQIIDLVGGVDILVDKGFSDNQYPIEGRENDLCDGDKEFRCRYETISFSKGLQHMDGNVALKYVRSRHADGEEGSDFSRGKRQQNLIVALKDKLLQPKVWYPPSKIKTIIKAFDTATDTNMNIGELATIGKIILQTKKEQIKKVSIDEKLIVPAGWEYSGRYVLVPVESWESIHTYIKSSLGIEEK